MTRKDAMKLFGRFLIIFGLCCPVFIAIGVGLGELYGDNVNGFLETMIYTVLGGLIILIEEYFYWKSWKQRMIAKKQTTPEKYFAEQKRIMMQKRNVTNPQPTENTSKRKSYRRDK